MLLYRKKNPEDKNGNLDEANNLFFSPTQYPSALRVKNTQESPWQRELKQGFVLK